MSWEIRIKEWMNMIENEKHKKAAIITYSYPFFYWYNIIQGFLIDKKDRTLIVIDEDIDMIIPDNLKNRIINQDIKNCNLDYERIVFSSTNTQVDVKETFINYGWDRIIYILNNTETNVGKFSKFIISNTSKNNYNPIIWILSSINIEHNLFSIPLTYLINKLLMNDNMKCLMFMDDIIPVFKLFRTNRDYMYKNLYNNYNTFLHSNQNLCLHESISHESQIYKLWKEWFNINLLSNKDIEVEPDETQSHDIPYSTCILYLNNEINNEQSINSIVSYIDYVQQLNNDSIYKESILSSFNGGTEFCLTKKNIEYKFYIETLTIFSFINNFIFIPLSINQKKKYKPLLFDNFKRSILSINDKINNIIETSFQEVDNIFNGELTAMNELGKYVMLEKIIESTKSKRMVVFFSNSKFAKSLYKYMKKKDKKNQYHYFGKNDELYDCKENGNHIIFISENISLLCKISVNTTFYFEHIVFWDVPTLLFNKKREIANNIMFEILHLCHMFQFLKLEIFWLIWKDSHEILLIEKIFNGYYNCDEKINKLLEYFALL